MTHQNVLSMHVFEFRNHVTMLMIILHCYNCVLSSGKCQNFFFFAPHLLYLLGFSLPSLFPFFGYIVLYFVAWSLLVWDFSFIFCFLLLFGVGPMRGGGGGWKGGKCELFCHDSSRRWQKMLHDSKDSKWRPLSFYCHCFCRLLVLGVPTLIQLLGKTRNVEANPGFLHR